MSKRKPKTEEGVLLAAVLAWLEAEKYLHWRMPLGPIIRGGGKKAIRFSPNPLAGFPDVCVCLKNGLGTIVCLELKALNGIIEPHQKAWHQKLEAAGILCVVPRSLDEAISFLRSKEMAA